jgi:nicotinate phosphoribosyltransferase
MTTVIPPISPLLTDLYQLTMAQAYLAEGLSDTQACFVASFRENPFEGGFAVAAGLQPIVEFLTGWHVDEAEVAYLRELQATDGTPLFTAEFLRALARLRFDCDVAAVPEGTLVFAREPLLRVTGSIVMCQLVETTVLNMLNFQTLIATKAARCALAAQGDPILEFGLRRAQGPDGGLSASRAAYIGGCAATSNVAAGQVFGIPVAGTHAHSWVMAHDTEAAAFAGWTHSSANNAVLLVDTYSTLEGVAHAVSAGRELESRGGHFAGIRIDSGDLAWLATRARELLDAAGLTGAKIYASNDLDEYTIASLKDQGAPIDLWGVGTRLVTGDGQSALGGVYKMTALRRADSQQWEPKLKLSEQLNKTTIAGRQGLRRYYGDDGSLAGDMVYDLDAPPSDGLSATMVDPADQTRCKTFAARARQAELLEEVIVGGAQVVPLPGLDVLAHITRENLAQLDDSRKRLLRPHSYPVGLEQGLYDRQVALVEELRGDAPGERRAQGRRDE